MHTHHTTLFSRTLLLGALSVLLHTDSVAAAPTVSICHWYGARSGILMVPKDAVAGHFSHGDSYPADWYVDLDGDGYGDPTSTPVDCPATQTTDDATDCDDTDPNVFPGNVELDDGLDEDCDLWVDEDFVAEGDVIITEVARQPRFGASSTQVNGQWFEIHNTSDRTVDLSWWYIMRSTPSLGTDAFFVDPEDPVILDPGAHAVFCKTDDYEGSASATFPLWCEYLWGDDRYSSTWHGTTHDNTFNLQRDVDRLGLFIEGGSLLGRSIDEVAWSYTSTEDTWPRVAARAMVLDPAFYDGAANDEWTSWCVAAADSAFTWWVSDTTMEYGTPGELNPDCP